VASLVAVEARAARADIRAAAALRLLLAMTAGTDRVAMVDTEATADGAADPDGHRLEDTADMEATADGPLPPAAGLHRPAASLASPVEVEAARAARAATLAAHPLRPAGMRRPGVADGVVTEATADMEDTADGTADGPRPPAAGLHRQVASLASPVEVEAARAARAATLAAHPLRLVMTTENMDMEDTEVM